MAKADLKATNSKTLVLLATTSYFFIYFTSDCIQKPFSGGLMPSEEGERKKSKDNQLYLSPQPFACRNRQSVSSSIMCVSYEQIVALSYFFNEN